MSLLTWGIFNNYWRDTMIFSFIHIFLGMKILWKFWGPSQSWTIIIIIIYYYYVIIIIIIIFYEG